MALPDLRHEIGKLFVNIPLMVWHEHDPSLTGLDMGGPGRSGSRPGPNPASAAPPPCGKNGAGTYWLDRLFTWEASSYRPGA